MAAASHALPVPAAGGMRRVLDAVKPPVRVARFWIVQAGVLSIALLHDVVLAGVAGPDHPFGVDAALSSALPLVPVIYAALTFGARGAVATALWAAALIVPHWWLMHPLSREHLSIELANLIILGGVAVVIGQRVEREQQQRHRAETSLELARTASARYQSLFEQQSSPVIITDRSGMINELNTAATRLLGTDAAGRALHQILPTTTAQLLDTPPDRVPLTTANGDQRLFVATAHPLDVEGAGRQVQIVLTDVTDHYRRQEEQRAFSGRLLAVQEEQRRQLAQELHDDPLQNLVYLARALDDLSEDGDLPARLAATTRYGSELAAEAASALRKVIHGLRPPILDDIGVASALRQLVADLRRHNTLSITLRCAGSERGLSADLRLTVYRIVQESLNNVVRHAGAGRATVTVRFGDPVVLTISDDGRGIGRPGTDGGPLPGLGLIGMRERISLAGGTMDVRPRSPHGTTVRATLPTCIHDS